MSLRNKLAQRRAWKSGVKHCTFNPDGPGVVRIHLIPPRFSWRRSPEYIVILNGYYLLPLGYSWAILLSAFMDEVNLFDGKPISDEESEAIVCRAIKKVAHIYPFINKRNLRLDLDTMLDILFDVARGKSADVEIEKLSIRTYAPFMTAPHRMDLMVSAMTDEHGTWKCNQKCRFCYAAGQPMGKHAEMDTASWKIALDRLKESGIPMVTFTGGEPTLRPDLVELIDHARWFVTRLNTNGIALKDATLVQALRDASLDSVQITLYSHHEEIHNDLTGSCHFADTVEGIRQAVAGGLDVSVNTPLCRKNADYAETLSFLYSLGVRFITVSGLICTGAAIANHEDYDLTEDELFSIVKQAKEFCDTHDMEMDFTSPGLISKEKLESLALNVPMCGAALSNMAICPDGTVVPCQSWLDGACGLGNILTDPFSFIWEHSRCQTLRAMSEEQALLCPFRQNKREESEKKHGEPEPL